MPIIGWKHHPEEVHVTPSGALVFPRDDDTQGLYIAFLAGCNKNAGKMGALKKIMTGLKINSRDIMAIGDSESDLGMISFAGIGVAMGNASKVLKANADFTVSDNDNDGVAEAIERFVFNGR